MKNLKNKIILILILIMFINNVNADFNQTIYNIDNVINKEHFKVKDNINSKFNLIDDSDRITNIQIKLKTDNRINNGININLSEKFNIVVLSREYTSYYLLPMKEIIVYGYVDNITFFKLSDNYTNIINTPITIDLIYTIETSNTSIMVQPNLVLPFRADNYLNYEIDKFIGMPTTNINIVSNNKFDIDLLIIDYGRELIKLNSKTELHGISKGLYYILTLGNLFESSSLILVLKLLDSLFIVLEVVFNLIFIFPYLILYWILITGNFYSAFKSNNRKELMLNYVIYYKFIGNIFIDLMKWIYTTILRLLTTIGNLLPFT